MSRSGFATLFTAVAIGCLTVMPAAAQGSAQGGADEAST